MHIVFMFSTYSKCVRVSLIVSTKSSLAMLAAILACSKPAIVNYIQLICFVVYIASCVRFEWDIYGTYI